MRLSRVVTVVVSTALAISGCTGGDDATSTTVEFIPADVPAGAAQTPFCSGMSAISLRVNTDPPDDLSSYLITEYEALLPAVPSAIASEFQTVLDALRSPSGSAVDTSDTTTETAGGETTAGEATVEETIAGFAEEGYLPDEEPALRLNAYLADNCFGTQSNPGPPPTQPLSELPERSTPAP